jgi:branched-chain amino acid transport system permease protein
VIAFTFAIGGALAGVASVVYGLYIQAVDYQIGFQNGLYAFTAAVLGGIGNIRGGMLGGLVLGLVERYSVPCFGARWEIVVSFVVLVLVLMLRPTGILGEKIGSAS